MGSKSRSSDLEAAIEAVLTEIDEHEYSSTDVAQQTTREFLEGIVSGCRVRIGALSSEEGEDDEEDEPTDLDFNGDDDDG